MDKSIKLTVREKKVYDYIKKILSQNGYSPSVRDIANALGIKSTSTVQACIDRLEYVGLIYKEEGKSRTIRIDGVDDVVSKIPIIGTIRAGSPISADENFDGYIDFCVPKGYDRENLFGLRVVGLSMKNAGILDGDIVVVNKTPYCENGVIVVALVDNGLTVKTFYKENGKYRLQPENDDFEPIILKSVEIVGRVIASYRTY